jgi:hypothetical protein
MNSKTLIYVFGSALLFLTSTISMAQDMLDEGMAEESEPERYTIGLELEVGGQIVEQDNNSSKFNEYRDNDTDALIHKAYLSIDDTETGRYLDFRGRNLSRDDQELYLELGLSRRWSVDFDWNETPHLLSNSARTPYDYLGNGRYRVAGGIVDDIQIFSIDDARTWTLPDAGPGGVGEDSRIAKVLRDSVHGIDLGTQRETGTFGIDFFFTERTKARFEFQREDKDGSILTGVAIGDRPPRSMTLQLPEPIDYTTTDFKFSLAHYSDTYSLDASYKYSRFENDVDQMSWNSLFHAANFNCATIPACAGAADYDRIRANGNLIGYRGTEYATTGTLTLSPDNTYQNFTLNGSYRLPLWNSRISASFIYTDMEQDETLLPYATSDFGDTLAALPRNSADAEIDSTLFNLTYNASPLRALNVNLRYRYYDMNNDTPQDIWIGTGQDTNFYNYRSQRINIAYDMEQENFGADLNYYLGSMGTLGFAYEKELIDRPHREVAETDEDRFTFSYRASPIDWANFRAEYTLSDRDGSAYNSEITDQSYAYDIVANAGQFENPLLGFGNSPGLRKYDVADRDRDEFDLSLSLLPVEGLSVNLSYRYINNDYGTTISDSINTWDAIALTFIDAFVDPTQLGLLEDETNRYTVEVNYAPTEALNLFGYYSRDEMDIRQRGRYLNENNRIDNIAAGKDWQGTDGGDIWDADIDDGTDTFAFGMNYKTMEDKVNLSADFSHSNGVVGIDYSAGFRLVEDDTTSIHNHAEWSSPPDVEFDSNTLNLGLTYALTEKVTLGFHYTFESYGVTDWMQDWDSAHKLRLSDNFVTEIDSETAGISNDRAGARLVALDDVLAPDYDVHWGIATINYKW